MISSKQIGYGPAIGCMCLVNLVGRYKDFGRTCCCHLPARKALFFAEDLGSIFHENDGTSLPSNMARKLGACHHVNLQLYYTYALITSYLEVPALFYNLLCRTKAQTFHHSFGVFCAAAKKSTQLICFGSTFLH